eukprot:5526733-Pyramimonas_sp.AAC.1
MGRVRRANPAAGAVGGAPCCRAAILMRGVPGWGGAAMRLARSVELLWGHNPREWCAELARGRHANRATGAFGGAPMEPRFS